MRSKGQQRHSRTRRSLTNLYDPPFGENIFYADSFSGRSMDRFSLTLRQKHCGSEKIRILAYEGLMQRCLQEYTRSQAGRDDDGSSQLSNASGRHPGSPYWRRLRCRTSTLDKQQGAYSTSHQHGGETGSVISATSLTAAGKAIRVGEGHRGRRLGFRAHTSASVRFRRKGWKCGNRGRQPYLLFDRMVAFHVQRSVPSCGGR